MQLWSVIDGQGANGVVRAEWLWRRCRRSGLNAARPQRDVENKARERAEVERHAVARIADTFDACRSVAQSYQRLRISRGCTMSEGSLCGSSFFRLPHALAHHRNCSTIRRLPHCRPHTFATRLRNTLDTTHIHTMSTSELAVSYAALILADDSVEITVCTTLAVAPQP